ncbi:MAG: type II toxin-antitoxin system Phd/YefM family antitoxin [Eggerthellaceae bacterium]
MPTVKPLSEFNRNQSAVISELKETQQPMYLTRNGSASIVVMDAEAFDRAMSFRASMQENEMRIYNSLMKGYADYLEGDVVEASEAEKAIMEEKGW